MMLFHTCCTLARVRVSNQEPTHSLLMISYWHISWLTPHLIPSYFDQNVPLSPWFPGKPGFPGNPVRPGCPGSPRGPWFPGGPAGPGGPGLLLLYPEGIWLSIMFILLIWPANERGGRCHWILSFINWRISSINKKKNVTYCSQAAHKLVSQWNASCPGTQHLPGKQNKLKKKKKITWMDCIAFLSCCHWQ